MDAELIHGHPPGDRKKPRRRCPYLAAIKFGGDVLVTAPGGGLPNKTRELVRHGGMSSFPYARSALDVARRSSPCRWDPALEPPACSPVFTSPCTSAMALHLPHLLLWPRYPDANFTSLQHSAGRHGLPGEQWQKSCHQELGILVAAISSESQFYPKVSVICSTKSMALQGDGVQARIKANRGL